MKKLSTLIENCLNIDKTKKKAFNNQGRFSGFSFQIHPTSLMKKFN